ncbi:MAG: putative fluoride ion transporter CrcB 1 [Alphaproteobacteria bacterium]|nr:MAG: putative fluoride ion transporter CrcB 1 [Alphaproteobacteria bacterium]
MALTQSTRLYLAVGAGAALGALARHLAALMLGTAGGLPLATALVNVVGSFVIAFFAIATGPDGRLIVRPAWRQFVTTGFCGGLTTFSVLSLETLLLAVERRPLAAILFVAGVIALSLAAAWAGYGLAMRYNRG